MNTQFALTLLIPVWAFLVDCFIGDPRSAYHPVVLIGKIISFYENIFYHEADSNNQKLRYGFCTVLATLITVLLISAGILWLAYFINYWLGYIIEILTLYITISPRALATSGFELVKLLKLGNIEQARYKVGWIVGRDTTELDESEITRATIETIAENTIDGIISPLLCFAFFGPLGAIVYRTINTMDSMLGYKNNKYLYFGRFAARLDDVANYLPARLCFILYIISAFITGNDYKKAWQIGLRDAAKHPSPNGGYAEAPVAGALHIRLGGYNKYGDRMTFREYMGDPIKIMRGIHIIKTISMMYICTIEALFLTICIEFGMMVL